MLTSTFPAPAENLRARSGGVSHRLLLPSFAFLCLLLPRQLIIPEVRTAVELSY